MKKPDARKTQPKAKATGPAKDTADGSTPLRSRAEKKLSVRQAESPDIKGSTAETLVHELQVHQIELEMQNEALRGAHIALEESRDKYSDLYEFAPVGYLTLTKKTTIEEGNLTSATILGIEKKKLIKSPFSKFVVSDDLERWEQYFIAVLRNSGKLVCELNLRKGDGSVISARIESVRTLQADKDPVVRMAVSDITERLQAEEELKKNIELNTLNEKLTVTQEELQQTIDDQKQVEEALRESEEKFRVLTQNLQSAVALIDENGAFSVVNASFLRMFGIPADADILNVNSQDWARWQVFNEDGTPLDVDQHPVRKVALTGRAVLNQLVAMKSPSGPDLKWLLISAEPIPDAHGGIHRIICTYYDITDRKKAEEALRESGEQLSSDLEAMKALQKLSVLFVSGGNLEPILTEIVHAAIAITGADFGNIQLLDPDTSELRIAAHCGFPDWWLDFWNTVSKGKGVCGTALGRGERVIVEDVEQSPIFTGSPALEIQRRAGVRAVQSTPLMNREGKPLGMFSTHFKVPHRPDDRQLRLLDLLARQAADIIERAESEEALVTKNIDLNALNEELTATQEELEQNVDDLNRNEEVLRQNEDRLKQALAEKEVLLSEIHHRVKNNLTAFISLLALDGSYEETPAGLALKKDLQNRARTMALIHETLYKTHQYSNVDMDVYLSTLVEQVVVSYSDSQQSIRTMVDAKGATLDLARATPMGLIVNELVTNSLKYAFPKGVKSCRPGTGDACTIGVRITKENGMVVLKVFDNGIGLPAGFDLKSTQTLGLKLVNFLARHQLRAKPEVNIEEGTEFTIRFKE